MIRHVAQVVDASDPRVPIDVHVSTSATAQAGLYIVSTEDGESFVWHDAGGICIREGLVPLPRALRDRMKQAAREALS